MANLAFSMPKVIGCLDDDVQEAASTVIAMYYSPAQQVGGAIDDFFVQHGQFGGWLGEKTIKRFYRALPAPIRAGLETLRDEALSGLKDFAGDVARGEDWRRAGLKRASTAGSNVLRRLMTGRGRNKSLHDAVKLYSFSPTTGGVGRSPPTRKRKRRRTASASASAPAAKRRRKAAGKRKAAKRKVGGRKRKTTSKRKPGRQRKQQQQQQQGSGFSGISWL
jgi:hypothetical protein